MNTFRETPGRPTWSTPQPHLPLPHSFRWPTTLPVDNCRRVNPERLTFSVVFEFETSGCKKITASQYQRLAEISLQALVSNCWWTSGCKKILCDHYPWCIGPHCTAPPPHTWDLRDPPASAIWWPSLETYSNRVTSGPHQCWHLVHTFGSSGRYASHWNAFLFGRCF